MLVWTAARFSERGIPSARLDAELLASHAFALARVQLYVDFDRPLGEPELAAFRTLVKRRLAGEPVAYLTGHREFWKLDLSVDHRVLVPRPETELLVEHALDCLPKGQAARVADVATGSGAIALALAHDRPEVAVFASDSSAEALTVARANAERLGLAVTFLEGHLGEPLLPHAPFDLLAANLPYIPTAEIPALASEVRREPAAALDGGADGLVLVRALVQSAPTLLRPGGQILLEIGEGQAQATAALCAEAGFTDVHVHRDLAGIDRLVVARKPEGTL